MSSPHTSSFRGCFASGWGRPSRPVSGLRNASVPDFPAIPSSGMNVKSSDCIARNGHVLKPTVMPYGPTWTRSVWTMFTGS